MKSLRNRRREPQISSFEQLGEEHPEIAETVRPLLARPPQTPEEIIERQESEQEILAVLERLPEKSREVLVLFYIQDFSYRETAQFLGISQVAVQGRLQVARQRLSKEMMQMVEKETTQTQLPPTFTKEIQTTNEELSRCFARMRKIGAAIILYRNEHGAMPMWLSDLVPQYLPDSADLICPERKDVHQDPHLPCTYRYLFHPIHPQFPFQRRETREQMERKWRFYGDVTPMVECGHWKRGRHLWLAYGGDVYDSFDGDWHKLPQALTAVLENLKSSLLTDAEAWWSELEETRGFVELLWLDTRFDELYPILEVVFAEAPNQPHAHWLWAKATQIEGDFEIALTHYQRAAQHLPNDTSLHQQIGETAEHIGRFDVAEIAYQRAIELREYIDTPSYQRLAVLYSETGETDKVQSLAEAWIKRNAANTIASSLGFIAESGERYSEAIEFYRTAIEKSLRSEKSALRNHLCHLRTRGIVEQRLLECYRKTGQIAEAEALQAQMTNPALTLIEPSDWERAEYALRLRWVEMPVSVVLKENRFNPPANASDAEFVEQLTQVVPDSELRYSTILPLNTETGMSTMLPFNAELNHVRHFQFRIIRQDADGSILLYYTVYLEQEGNLGAYCTSNIRSFPIDETKLFDRFVLQTDNRSYTWMGDFEPEAFRESPSDIVGEFCLFMSLLDIAELPEQDRQPHQYRTAQHPAEMMLPNDESTLESMRKSNPLDRRVYGALAKLYADRGEGQNVSQLIDEFTEHHSLLKLGFQLGDIYKAGKCYDKASEVYEKSLSFRTDTQLKQALIECYEQLGKHSEAKAIRDTPDTPTTDFAPLWDRRARLLGQPAPDFTLQALNGETYRLKDLRGQVVLLNFFRIPSGGMQVMTGVERMHKKYQSMGLVVLGITTETDKDKIQAFMHGLASYPVLIDTDEISKQYSSSDSFIVDRDGIVQDASQQLGELNTTLSELLSV